MNAYQQKWIELLKAANLHGWEIEPVGNDIAVKMPGVTDLKLLRDNLPEVLGSLSLDIDEPKERLQFIFRNGHEKFEYILNPTDRDLNRP